MSNIDPTAIVSPDVEIGADVTIGPFAIVEEGVTIGDHCVLLSHSIIRKKSILGAQVRVDSFAVVGGDPQDLSFDPTVESGVKIGERVVIREGVTIHRSSQEAAYTEIGSECYLMGNSHVAHDCQVGKRCVLANGAMLAGHVHMGEDVFVGGGAGIQQFQRVGMGSMIGGNAAISRDVPPQVLVADRNLVFGLNIVGLRRRKIPTESIGDLKRCYAFIFDKLENPSKLAVQAKAKELGHTSEGRDFLEFFQEKGRKYCRPRQKGS